MTRIIICITSALILTACNTVTIQTENRIPAAVDIQYRKDKAPEAVTAASATDIDTLTTVVEKQRAGEPDTSSEKDYASVWSRISDNLMLQQHADHSNVQDKINWYARNQDYLDRVAERARPYLFFISQELEKRNMPLDLALLPVVESAYNPFAYSPSKASGLWQFIPGTGRHYGLQQDWWYDGRRDIVAATRAALDYLEKLHKEFDGDWLLALAAYNTGEGNVARAINRNKKSGKGTDFWSLRLPRETRGYVPSLLAIVELLANPDRYKISWQEIPDLPYFAEIDTGSQIDLAMAAEMADMSMDELYLLNPGFNRWATSPEGPHKILIPSSKRDSFLEKLTAIPDHERISWQRHIIKKGESLGLLADRYHTSITALQQSNNLRSNLIREGHSLLIPISKQPMKHYTLSMDSRRFRGLEKTGTGKKYVYTIRRGDTLWDIGNNYGVSVNNLCAWNGISANTILRLGQKLNLWFQEETLEDNSRLAASTIMQTDPALPETATGMVNYTVRQGDSLWLIARRYSTTVAKLSSWNNLVENSIINPGQVLSLQMDVANAGQHPDSSSYSMTPVNYIVIEGDSLWLISKRFGTTVADLRKWNNLPTGNHIKPGQKIILYTREA
jgi:membrane-bound lytic murein transglycosylase D